MKEIFFQTKTFRGESPVRRTDPKLQKIELKGMKESATLDVVQEAARNKKMIHTVDKSQ